MTEENQVELDTDDAKEETLHLAEKPKEEKPEKVEVDLGYTDPIKTETKAKVVEEETTDDNLQDVSENVQKRIDKLTKRTSKKQTSKSYRRQQFRSNNESKR